MQITSTGKEFDESRVYIGWRGENRAEQIEFVMPRFYAGTDLLETDCVLELWSKDGYYDEIPLTLEGDTETKALWEPTLAVMSRVGDLYGRLSFVIGEGNVVLKTSQVNFYVRDARDIDGQIEQEYPTELQSLRMRVSAFEAALADGSLKGEQGEPGVIFTPAVSNGILSWSNDGGLPNPDAVSIKGPQGDRGPQGEQGPKGDKGDKGERGEKGAPFVYEDFTADQIEALKVKGDKGDKGDQGDQGERGAYFTPYVQDDGTLTWRNNGGYENPPDKNIIGPQGEQGIQGEPGPKGEKGDKGEVGATGPAVVPSVDAEGVMSFALQDTPVLPDPVSVRGPQGDTGAVPNITVGTVSTLPPGSSATVTRQEGSTNENPVLDFGLPAGRDGEGSGDMVAAVYDPTNKAQDIFAYADTLVNNLPVKRLVGTASNPVQLNDLLEDGIYYISGNVSVTGLISEDVRQYLETLLSSGYPFYVCGNGGDPEVETGCQVVCAPTGTQFGDLLDVIYRSFGSSYDGRWKIASLPSIDIATGQFPVSYIPDLSSEYHPVTWIPTAADVGAIPTAEKGAANGVASLDGTGKVPTAQLPAMNYDPAGSAAAVDTKLTTHIADTVKHVTADERTNWNSKASNILDGSQNASVRTIGSTEESGSYTMGEYAFAEGANTVASGVGAHAEGIETISSGQGAHAEGSNCEAGNDYSHAEGDRTTASGGASHAEGSRAQATDEGAHAEGQFTVASCPAAHAEGLNSTASGEAAHAQGYMTSAGGAASHSEGFGTSANSKAQHAQGEYNIVDTAGTNGTRGTYAHIVGNGTADNARSNAHTLDWSGNAWFAGDVTDGGGNVLSNKANSAHTHTATDIASGSVAVNRGGTGKTSWTANRLIYPSASTTLTQLAFPSVAGSVLRQGTNGAPYWTSLADLAASMGGAKIETGSYVGTGTSGENNPNTLTFSFAPKIVIIFPSTYAGGPGYFGYPSSAGMVWSTVPSESFKQISISWNGNSVSWYATHSTASYAETMQMNNAGKTFYYLAIG